jgi:hypothetical protein
MLESLCCGVDRTVAVPWTAVSVAGFLLVLILPPQVLLVKTGSDQITTIHAPAPSNAFSGTWTLAKAMLYWARKVRVPSRSRCWLALVAV